MTTALIHYQDRWAVEDPVLDWVILQHDKKEYEEMMASEESREEKAARYIKESGKTQHTSDCATSVAPAEEPGPCDCDMPNDEVCKCPPGCECGHHIQLKSQSLSLGPCQAESLIWAAVCDTLPAESVKALSQRVIELRKAKTWLPIGAFSWCGGFTQVEQPVAPEAGNDQGVPPQPKCKNCGKFKAMHQGWRWCGIPAKPNSFFQPDDEPEPHPVSAEPQDKRPEPANENLDAGPILQEDDDYADAVERQRNSVPSLRKESSLNVELHASWAEYHRILRYVSTLTAKIQSLKEQLNFSRKRTDLHDINNQKELERVNSQRDLCISTLRAENARLEMELADLRAVQKEQEDIVLSVGPITCRNGKQHPRIDKCLYCIIDELLDSHEEVCRLLRLIRYAPHPMPPKSELSNELIDAALANAAKLTETKKGD